MPWWGSPPDTLYRASTTLPKLLKDRADSLGLDYFVLFPTQGLQITRVRDADTRRALCRAYNHYVKEFWGQYPEKMTVAAAIPMFTPEEAVAELEYAVRTLGLKVMMMDSFVLRPIPWLAREHPEIANLAERVDSFAIDSEYDYDPVWAKCLELRVPVTSHRGSIHLGFRRSISRFAFNHIGHFATAGEVGCKSMFFGGVTRRFPELKLGYLEGGAAWAATLYASLVVYWQRRGLPNIGELDPALIDEDYFVQLASEYGGEPVRAKLAEVRAEVHAEKSEPRPAELDDWALADIRRGEDVRDLFVPSFYFGVEADDPTTPWAFDTKVNPYGARLKVMLSSDIGHWDTVHDTDVVAESYEMVEQGRLSKEDYRDFAFTHAVEYYGGMNPDFFKGTAIEREAEEILSRSKVPSGIAR
jgi:predicted TIM-barrel fold metal-dependent hydrolase